MSDAFMPSVPIVTPSRTATVLNSMGVPPALRMPAFTCSASSRWLMLQGIVSIQVVPTPISGFARSASVKPMALSIARAPARSGPSVSAAEWRLAGSEAVGSSGMTVGSRSGRASPSGIVRLSVHGRPQPGSPPPSGRAVSVQAGARFGRRSAADAGADPRPDLGATQRVADVLVRPRLGVDDPADRPVREDQRTAAVAAIDLGAELEDLPAHAVRAVDVV